MLTLEVVPVTWVHNNSCHSHGYIRSHVNHMST